METLYYFIRLRNNQLSIRLQRIVFAIFIIVSGSESISIVKSIKKAALNLWNSLFYKYDSVQNIPIPLLLLYKLLLLLPGHHPGPGNIQRTSLNTWHDPRLLS